MAFGKFAPVFRRLRDRKDRKSRFEKSFHQERLEERVVFGTPTTIDNDTKVLDTLRNRALESGGQR